MTVCGEGGLKWPACIRVRRRGRCARNRKNAQFQPLFIPQVDTKDILFIVGGVVALLISATRNQQRAWQHKHTTPGRHQGHPVHRGRRVCRPGAPADGVAPPGLHRLWQQGTILHAQPCTHARTGACLLLAASLTVRSQAKARLNTQPCTHTCGGAYLPPLAASLLGRSALCSSTHTNVTTPLFPQVRAATMGRHGGPRIDSGILRQVQTSTPATATCLIAL